MYVHLPHANQSSVLVLPLPSCRLESLCVMFISMGWYLIDLKQCEAPISKFFVEPKAHSLDYNQ